jgi:hypothetical protein
MVFDGFVSAGSCSISNSNGVITITGNPKKILLNGRELDLKLEAVSAKSESSNKEYSTSWKINCDKSSVSSVVVSGSAEIKINRDIITKNSTLTVSGSGVIRLCYEGKFDQISAIVSGSGDVHLCNSEILDFSATVSGSGDISGFVITKRGRLVCSGSGDITGSRSAFSDVHKTCVGSGDITVRKI